MANILDGVSCFLLDDLWLNKVPRLHYPLLIFFAKSKEISLSAARNAEGPKILFNLPLSPLLPNNSLS